MYFYLFPPSFCLILLSISPARLPISYCSPLQISLPYTVVPFCLSWFLCFLFIVYSHLKTWSQELRVRADRQSLFLFNWVLSIQFMDYVLQVRINEKSFFMCLLPYDKYYLKTCYVDDKVRIKEVCLFAQKKMTEF